MQVWLRQLVVSYPVYHSCLKKGGVNQVTSANEANALFITYLGLVVTEPHLSQKRDFFNYGTFFTRHLLRHKRVISLLENITLVVLGKL